MRQIRRLLSFRFFLFSLSCFLLFHSGAHAGDPVAGKKRAVVCANCHGAAGISIIPMYPNLAGQKELYLIDALKAYRSGMRKHMLMTPQAASLSDTDIENLAAYYAGLGDKSKD